MSHCKTTSEREAYVTELQKYIQVDVMGACGSIKCEKYRLAMIDNCSKSAEADYKFYLSLENSFCSEYVTEKFYRRITEMFIPITLGAANYTNLAPHHSYIDALSFESPKALAKYILHLDENEDEYLFYFWWQERFKVQLDKRLAFCKLCEMLHDPNWPPKVYPDMTKWWRGKGNCLKKGDYPWSIPNQNYSMKKLTDVLKHFAN